MEVPHLRLTVEKGPKEGETLEKKPGTKVRIGRVVRGNNFIIKDDGISSKHLLIEVKDLNWVIYDLDTSNGTFLNGVQIEPNSPFLLKNGDLIKIGELTSIKVGIREKENVEEKEEKVVPKPKQIKGLKKIGESVSTSVQGGADVEDDGVGPVRRNTRRGAVAEKKEQVPEVKPVPAVETRRRGRKKAAPVADGVAEVNIGNNDKVLSKPCVGDDSQSVAEMIVSESPEVIVGDSSKGKKVVESPKVEVGDSSKGNNVACDTATENSTNEEKMTLEKLQKMTLGEWFDYLEVYLVKQIYKETDEIIDGMRAKAEEFKKFMSEQQKLKNKSPVLRD
ncbi:hypothetical protein ACHQM5_025175 [Ranunculus cassubicifolius]